MERTERSFEKNGWATLPNMHYLVQMAVWRKDNIFGIFTFKNDQYFYRINFRWLQLWFGLNKSPLGQIDPYCITSTSLLIKINKKTFFYLWMCSYRLWDIFQAIRKWTRVKHPQPLLFGHPALIDPQHSWRT